MVMGSVKSKDSSTVRGVSADARRAVYCLRERWGGGRGGGGGGDRVRERDERRVRNERNAVIVAVLLRLC